MGSFNPNFFSKHLGENMFIVALATPQAHEYRGHGSSPREDICKAMVIVKWFETDYG